MKALMVNSLNPTSIVEHKMKDQLYMKHLRQVEKINNREAQKITNDVKSYHSINDLHHKHKAYAYHWHNKEEDALVQQLNIKMKRKMQEIKSYFNHKLSPKDNTQAYSQTSRVANRSSQGELATKQQPTQSNEPQKSNQMAKKEKKNMSLHYRYRKKRQEQIDRQNQKLEKGILSQRSSYFPQIHKNRQSISALGSKKQQKSIQKELKQQQKQQKQKK